MSSQTDHPHRPRPPRRDSRGSRCPRCPRYVAAAPAPHSAAAARRRRAVSGDCAARAADGSVVSADPHGRSVRRASRPPTRNASGLWSRAARRAQASRAHTCRMSLGKSVGWRANAACRSDGRRVDGPDSVLALSARQRARSRRPGSRATHRAFRPLGPHAAPPGRPRQRDLLVRVRRRIHFAQGRRCVEGAQRQSAGWSTTKERVSTRTPPEYGRRTGEACPPPVVCVLDSAQRRTQRNVAANSRSSALRILARTAAISFSPSVRSGERIVTRSASERLSAGTWSPSYTSKTWHAAHELASGPARRPRPRVGRNIVRDTTIARSWKPAGRCRDRRRPACEGPRRPCRSMLSDATYSSSSSMP